MLSFVIPFSPTNCCSTTIGLFKFLSLFSNTHFDRPVNAEQTPISNGLSLVIRQIWRQSSMQIAVDLLSALQHCTRANARTHSAKVQDTGPWNKYTETNSLALALPLASTVRPQLNYPDRCARQHTPGRDLAVLYKLKYTSAVCSTIHTRYTHTRARSHTRAHNHPLRATEKQIAAVRTCARGAKRTRMMFRIPRIRRRNAVRACAVVPELGRSRRPAMLSALRVSIRVIYTGDQCVETHKR